VRRSAQLPENCDVLVVGAGFGGLYMAHRLRLLGFDAHIVEAGGGVGGTWYWNRYPGARCDIESIQYSYAFDETLQQEYVWTERYATQPEILRYAEHVADRFDLWSGLTLNTRVVGADFDEANHRWMVRTDAGEAVRATFLIAAVGCLSTAQTPEWPGLETFAGDCYHTGAWPQEDVDLTDKRVGVIGTGSSGIQVIPVVAEQAAHLTVFHRTANYAMPARNRRLPLEELAELKSHYAEIRAAARRADNGRCYATEGRPLLGDSTEQQQAVLAKYWEMGGLDFCRAYSDISSDPVANQIAADFVRARIAEIVSDPGRAKVLSPDDHGINKRRPCLTNGYFEAFNRSNVELVDVRRDPIAGLSPAGVRTESGRVHNLDVVVFATGFDAMTGTLVRLNLRGRDGVSLQQAWAEGPRTYLGLTIAGFPNFFAIAGPGSPSVLSNVILAIEQHVEWLGDLLVHTRERGIGVIEAEPEAQAAWTAHNAEVAEKSGFGAGSWYEGANVPGKPRVLAPYVGGTDAYRAKCDDVAARGYPGFRLARRDASVR
jgi:cyclohexanone monooxygenase